MVDESGENPVRERLVEIKELPEGLPAPMLMAVPDMDPALFEYDEREPVDIETGEVAKLPKDVSPAWLQRATEVRYEPVLICDKERPLDMETLSAQIPGYRLELAREMGPFLVYALERKGAIGKRRLAVFGSRQMALGVVGVKLAEAGVVFVTPEVDVPPIEKEAELPGKRYRLKKGERAEIKKYFEEVLESEFLQRVTQTNEVGDYPRAMLAGLMAVRDRVNQEGLAKTDPRSKFVEVELGKLIVYLDYMVNRPDLAGEQLALATEASMDYVEVMELMKQQADLMGHETKKASREPILIPWDKIQGCQSRDGTSVFVSGEKIVVYHHQKGRFEFPLPVGEENVEVAIKGGVARLIAKILFNLETEAELPPSDVDVVVFKEGQTSTDMGWLKREMGVEAKDVEVVGKLGLDGLKMYLANRDQNLNEVLLTRDGLVVSKSAIAGYCLRGVEASAEPEKNLFGRHVVGIESQYLADGRGGDSLWINGARFPMPRVMARMIKSLIEDKADTMVVPRGALKMDLGIHWLVMARKFMAVEDEGRRRELLDNMLTMAYLTRSKYYQAMDNPEDPMEFIAKVKQMAPGGREFDLDQHQMSEKETLDWLAGRLVRSIITDLDRFVGYDQAVGLKARLTNGDTDLMMLTLPRPEKVAREIEEAGINPKSEEAEKRFSLNRAELILHNLGLTWESLAGKKVLDVGTGEASLARAASWRESTATITSIDIDRDEEWIRFPWGKRQAPIQADAERLPFRSGLFDFAIMHGSTGLGAIPEAVRILRPGGEMRMYPIAGIELEYWNISYYLDKVKHLPQQEIIDLLEGYDRQIREADGWMPDAYVRMRKEALNNLSREQKLEVIDLMVKRYSEITGLAFSYQVGNPNANEPNGLLIYKKS